ncbi:VOC family protein [Cellulomonas sp.]|uniref:VOC family protein n=1 Tax=Cellulomonas sp. TaxID=40001 RepID=UPI003BA9F9B9
MIHLTVTSVFVDDQRKALDFYTGVLGFVPKNDIPLGGEDRWLTVVSPAAPDGVELLLEPSSHPAVGPYKAALVEDGIPAASFGVDDLAAEYERLTALGVRFVQPPTDMGPVIVATLDDTCGNLVQLAQTTLG